MWSLAALFAVAGASFAAYKFWTRPVHLTAAVVAQAVEEGKVLTAFGRLFSQSRVGVRMRVVVYPSREELVKAFLDRKADVAVMRADQDVRGQASVVAVMAKSVGFVVALDPKITDIGKLRGKRVGLVSVAGNSDGFFAALLEAYDIRETEVQKIAVEPEAIQKVAEEKRVDVLVGATPLLFRRSGENLRALLKQPKAKLRILPVDRADVLVRRHPAFEDFEIPAGTFGALPEEDVSSVALATNLVVQSTMPNDVASILARQFLSNRQTILSDAPSASQIAAPSTEKDSFVRVHPGVAAYIDDEEQTFFDKYGDLVYIFMAIGGVLGSGFVALRRSFGPDREADACDLVDDLVDLRREARALASRAPGPDAADKWEELSARFETMLAAALPLIADSSVADRTVQALSTALAAAERSLANVAPIALRASASGDGFSV